MHALPWVFAALPTVAIFWWLIASGRRVSRIEKTGRPGRAFVQSVHQDTGGQRGAPIIRFTCLVTPDDGAPPYQADTSPFVAQTTLASLYVGQTLPVRIHPEKPSEFYFVGDDSLYYADAEHP